ncbi:Phosphopantetheine attachment site, partial [Streptomyces sp. DvalAA-14]|uniref:phosphopantetheine-binding protein n=1 Tax=unclassified Streptomyces TaxID=2593676 RepID=UPI00081B8C88
EPLDPDAALDLLGAAVAGKETTLAVAEVDWDRFAPALTAVRPSPLIADLPQVRRGRPEPRAEQPAPSASELTGTLAGLSPTDQERHLLTVVRTEVAAALGHAGPDAVDPERALKQLGFDSLMVVTLRNRLHAVTGLRLPATLAFDHPTPAAIALFLRGELAPEAAGPSVRDQLAGLRAAVSAAASADVREELATGLRAVLAELAATAGEDTEPAPAQRLLDASDQDVFDFIDNELGNF